MIISLHTKGYPGSEISEKLNINVRLKAGDTVKNKIKLLQLTGQPRRPVDPNV